MRGSLSSARARRVRASYAGVGRRAGSDGGAGRAPRPTGRSGARGVPLLVVLRPSGPHRTSLGLYLSTYLGLSFVLS